MAKVATLIINSHNIVFTKMHPLVKDALKDYCRNLISYNKVKRGRGKKVLLVKKDVYAASTFDRSEIRFHFNIKEDLLRYLRNSGFREESFDIINGEISEGDDVSFSVKDTREPFDYQVGLINYLIEPGRSKVITLETGGGKSKVTLDAIAKINKRLMIVVLGRYVKKWISDVEKAYHLKKGDLLVIRGSNDLISIMNHATAGTLDAKIIIITSTTMSNYIKDYEIGGERGYPVKPGNLYRHLGVGVKVIDEAHMFFHLNFKMDLYSNVSKAIFLSATLEPSDGFLDRMYKIIYPLSVRMQGKAKDCYTDVIALSYRIKGARYLRCKRNGSYSHVLFENEIMKYNRTLLPYLKFICKIVEDSFLRIKKDGQKMMIFAATVEMCSRIRDYLSIQIKDHTVAKYTAEDNYEVLHNNDIVISTLGSAGTAVDIINLKTCLMTVSISSIQQNIQALGRLRKLVNYPGDHPEFIYIYSSDIERQRAYHLAKYDTFKGHCRSHKNYDTHYMIEYSNRK